MFGKRNKAYWRNLRRAGSFGPAPQFLASPPKLGPSVFQLFIHMRPTMTREKKNPSDAQPFVRLFW